MLDETVTVMVASGQEGHVVAVAVPRRIGHVRVGEVLGEGTGGVVFSGYDDALNRRVAIRVLSRFPTAPGGADTLSLVDGVRAAAHVKHLNVATIYAVEDVDGLPIIVMECIEGVSLQALLRRSGALEPALAVYVLRCGAACPRSFARSSTAACASSASCATRPPATCCGRWRASRSPRRRRAAISSTPARPVPPRPL